MARAMGIVAFEGDNINVEGLSKHRPFMSISFLGRYRLMDFMLSNYTNSKIDDIHIYVKENQDQFMNMWERVDTIMSTQNMVVYVLCMVKHKFHRLFIIPM